MIPGVLQAQKRATGVQGSARDAEWQAGVPQSVRKCVPMGYLWAPRMPLVVVRVKVWDSQCEHANMPPPPLSGGLIVGPSSVTLAGMPFLRKVPIVSPTLGVGLICAQRKHQTRIRETLENDSASPMWGCGFAGTKRGFGGSGNGPGCRLAPGVSHLRIQRRSAAPLQ